MSDPIQPGSDPAEPRTLRRRFALAVVVAAFSAAYVIAFAAANPEFISDFDQIWGAGRALLDGQNPYLVVGPRKQYHWHWPFYYPLPAVIATLPLALLPVVWARALFAAASAGLLAWAFTRGGFARWPIFISLAFITAVELVQWSPILTAALLMPSLGWLAVAKPNFGVAMALHAQSDRALILLLAPGFLLVAVSFLVLPTWFSDWLGLVRSAPHFRAPVARPLGFLLLLALVRWRRPEARLLAGLALVPQTPTFYDHLFAFVAARTFRESLTLAAGTVCVYLVLNFYSPVPRFEDWGNIVANATVLLVYLPAVVMVLRRPNEGELPASVTRIARALRLIPRGVRA